MSNAYENILDLILEAARSGEVATVANVSPSRWSLSHVFIGHGALIGARNRGRAPFIDVLKTVGDFEQVANDTNREGQDFRIRVYTRRTLSESKVTSEAIIRTFLRTLKSLDEKLIWKAEVAEIKEISWGSVTEIILSSDIYDDDFDFNEE